MAANQSNKRLGAIAQNQGAPLPKEKRQGGQNNTNHGDYRCPVKIITTLTVTALILTPLRYHGKWKESELEQQPDMVPALLMKENEPEYSSEKVELLLLKDCRNQSQKDVLFLEYGFIEFSLPQVFVIPLVHICGAEFLSTTSSMFSSMFSSMVSSMFSSMVSAGGLVDLVVSLTVAVFVVRKLKNQNKDLMNEVSQLKEELQKKETVVTKVKTELENQQDEVKDHLKEVEKEREVNKQKLQEVENEIKEKEKIFEKPEELQRDRENLFREQWRLDQTKKDNEKYLLNMDKLLEPMESQG